MQQRNGPALFFYAAVIVLVAAIFGFAIYRGTSGSSEDTENSDDIPLRTLAPGETFAPALEFVSPADGDVVANPIEVQVAVGGVTIKPASEPAAAGEGHFRILLNAPETLPPGQPAPDEYTLVDLADGSNVVTLEPLPAGAHTLTVVFEDSDHIPLPNVPPDRITITVGP